MNAPFAANIPHAPRLEARHFLLLSDTGAFADYSHAELVEGEILCMNAEYSPHARIKSWLTRHLGNALEALGSPYEAWAEPSVLMNDDFVPQPDIVLTSHKGDGLPPLSSIALIIEVSDTTLSRDLGQKAALYAKAAVPEYWVVDIEGRCVHQFWRPQGGVFAERRDAAFGAAIDAATIPGLKLSGFGPL